MILSINNINKVQEALIKLNGLTVIAGENGSGKSTVGKMLFSVVQVLKSTQDKSFSRSDNLLDKHIRALYTRIRSIRALRSQNLYNAIPREYQLKKMLIESEITIPQLREYVVSIISQIENVTPRTKANIENDLKNLELIIEKRSNPAAVQASSIQSLIESEFMNSVCSVGTDISKVFFDISDAEESNISFSIENNIVKEVKCKGQEYLEDATYVESPLYLHMIDTLSYSMQYVEVEGPRAFFRIGMIPTHIKDFINKMAYAKDISVGMFNENKELITHVEDIMKGSFRFNKDTNRLNFVSDGNSFSPINTASGTKTFGVLQLLLQSEIIGPNKVLIWDEPENHLHPEWQVHFANVILQLVQAGIPIVISTHSPYFIQAIRFYSAKYNAEKDVNYYFADTIKHGLSRIFEVTDNLNLVFSKLAEPLRHIMNIPNPKSAE
ncbi:MAG: ATP-binding protein [Bacteroides sp.]|nr:ATP-binding protein [Bacteroides sp.]